MTKLRAVFAIFATLIVAACYPPVTKSPVGLTVGIKADPALSGLWAGKGNDGQPSYMHFLPQADGSFTVLIVGNGDQVDEEWDLVNVTTAKFGTNGIMNATMISTRGKPEPAHPGTVPVLYRIDGGTLTLALLDEEKVKDAIRAGKIKGDAGDGGTSDATITADPAVLDKFISSPAGMSLFDKPFFKARKVTP